MRYPPEQSNCKMNEKRLKLIIEKHSPQAKPDPILFFNSKINEGLKSVSKARRSRGSARDKEKRIRVAMDEIYDHFQYATEPIMLYPMETAILLNQVRWNIFDQGVSLRIFKEKENQDFYLDFDNSLDKLFSRIPQLHQQRAKKITEYLRILKFLPCLESEISYQETVNNGLKFKWTALALSLIFTFFISVGLNSFKIIIPGITLSIVAYILTSFVTNGGKNTDEIPGGFNQRYKYLSKRSLRYIKENCMLTLESLVRENKWRYPTTLSQTQKLKPRCLNKIMLLADPSTHVSVAEPTKNQLACL